MRRVIVAVVAIFTLAVPSAAGAAEASMTFVPIEGIRGSTVYLHGHASLTVPGEVGAAVSAAREAEHLPNVVPATATAASHGRARAARDRRARAANYVGGDCGLSWLFIYPDSNNTGIYAVTGFSTNGAEGSPYYMHWLIDGENLSYFRGWYGEWGMPWYENYWEGTHYAIKGAGLYYGLVDTGESYLLGTRGACFSGGPTSVTEVR